MKKLKKLSHRFTVRHTLGLKKHLAQEDVLEELLIIILLKRGCDLLSVLVTCSDVLRHVFPSILKNNPYLMGTYGFGPTPFD